METLDDLLEDLCEVLEDDFDRQEDLLALCKAQGRAALEHDVELLEARTEAINALIADTTRGEAKRIALAAALVQHYRLPVEQQTLSDLINAAHEPWKQRLHEFQTRMRAVLAETREVVRANNGIIRRSARVVNEALDVLTLCAPAPKGEYDARGGERGAGMGTPAFLDQRG